MSESHNEGVDRLMTVDNLGKRYGSRWLFRNLSFEVEQGQVLLIRGRNGSGKSTLLKCLVGLIEPTSGEVYRPVEVGYYGLDSSAYAELTGREHLEMLGTNEVGQFEQIGLGQAINQKVGEYSSGMRGRLKLLVAQVNNPPLLLLDEPTAALDATGQGLVEELVRAQQSRGAVVIATNSELDAQWGTHELTLE